MVEIIKFFFDIENIAHILVLLLGAGVILFTALHLYVTKDKLVYGYSFQENVTLQDGVDKEKFMKACRKDEYLVIVVMILVMTFSVQERFAYISSLTMIILTSYMIVKDRKLQNQIKEDYVKKDE